MHGEECAATGLFYVVAVSGYGEDVDWRGKREEGRGKRRPGYDPGQDYRLYYAGGYDLWGDFGAAGSGACCG
jgi:chloramphenicol 3-O-phosphotransferase